MKNHIIISYEDNHMIMNYSNRTTPFRFLVCTIYYLYARISWWNSGFIVVDSNCQPFYMLFNLTYWVILYCENQTHKFELLFDVSTSVRLNETCSEFCAYVLILLLHAARFSPDDKYSRQRILLKKRFGLLPTQGPPPKY